MEKTEIQGRVQELSIVGENEIMNRNLWEQRRYEIAKDVFSRSLSNSIMTDEHEAEIAVAAADALIAELQKGR